MTTPSPPRSVPPTVLPAVGALSQALSPEACATVGTVDQRASWPLPVDPSSATMARRLARLQLADWGIDAQISVTELLISELVTNALCHGRGPIGLALRKRDGILRCEVRDAGPGEPRILRPSDSDEGGRGLYLVEALSRRWGAERTGTGKVVWFELATNDRSHD